MCFILYRDAQSPDFSSKGWPVHQSGDTCEENELIGVVIGAIITYVLTLLMCLFRVLNHDRGRNNEVYKVSVSCKENTLLHTIIII